MINIKRKKINDNKPWINYYDEGVPKSFDYPDLMLWEMIEKSSLKYPTKREMRIHSEELYNLVFEGSVNRSGYNLFTNFSIDILDPKFVKEKDYLENFY